MKCLFCGNELDWNFRIDNVCRTFSLNERLVTSLKLKGIVVATCRTRRLQLLAGGSDLKSYKNTKNKIADLLKVIMDKGYGI